MRIVHHVPEHCFPHIVDAPYSWLTFLGVLGIRVLNGTFM